MSRSFTNAIGNRLTWTGATTLSTGSNSVYIQIKPTGANSLPRTVSFGNGTSDTSLGQDPGGGGAAQYKTNAFNVTSPPSVPLNSWGVIVGVINGSTGKISSSGTPAIDTGAVGVVASANASRIGVGFNWRGASTTESPFQGLIARVAIWSGILTDAEMQLLANGTLPENLTPSSAVLFEYWDFTQANAYSLTGEVGGRVLAVTGSVPTSTDDPGVAPVLSSPTPSGTLGTQTTATVGATTDTVSGTAYAVLGTGSQLTGITAAQVIAGQKANGTAASFAANNAISDATPDVPFTGLTPGVTYTYAIAQQSSGVNSNVVTGSFTTLELAPVLSLPTPSGNVSPTASVPVGATTTKTNGTFYTVVGTGSQLTGVTASQIIAGQQANGSPAAFSGNSAVATVLPSVLISGLAAETAYTYASVQVGAGGTSNVVTGSFATADPPVISTQFPSGTLGTAQSATVGAYTTHGAQGSMYVVIGTGSQLTGVTAAQVIAGQQASGAAAMFAANDPVTQSPGLVPIAGLTANTAYTYAIVQRISDLSISAVLSGSFTTAVLPVLVSPTPSGTIGSPSMVTVGATTNKVAGLFYAVLGTGTQLSGVTAAQIAEGQQANGDPAINSASSMVGTASPSAMMSGLTDSTLYTYAATQWDGFQFSNVVTGSFTTSAPMSHPGVMGDGVIGPGVIGTHLGVIGEYGV